MQNTNKQNIHKIFSSSVSYSSEEIKLDSGIIIWISQTCIKIIIPFATLGSLFYKISDNVLEISNDLRMLYTGKEVLDSAGINSLLIFGAVVPPLSPFKNIKSFIPGFKYEINPNTFEIKSEIDCHWSIPKKEDFNMNMDDQVLYLTNRLNNALKDICPEMNPIVLFSGGIDSSVMALIIKEMGWYDASYLHYTFGKDDKETIISKKIAAFLDISIDIVPGDPKIGFSLFTKGRGDISGTIL